MREQYVIRPVKIEDLPTILALAEKAKPGLTNLLPDKGLLAQKIEWSIDSFSKKITSPENELYFFVMENLRDNRVIGTCGIFSDVGEEFYSFKVTREMVSSELLNLKKENLYLQLVNDYKNVSELALLLMGPRYRKKGLGKLLSRSRYLFLADNLSKFHHHIIAEMRGVIDIWGKSPFWNAVGSRFIDLTFTEADLLSAKKTKHFISELMPHTPIPIGLLPPVAIKVIGKPHADTAGAVKVLQEEGFEYSHYVDIFDGGPTLEAQLKHVKTVEQSVCAKIDRIEKNIVGEKAIISFQGDEFRVAMGDIVIHDHETISISHALARTLHCDLGDTVRYHVSAHKKPVQ